MEKELPIQISSHAYEQMEERGVSEEEVIVAVQEGESEIAELGKTMFRKNFQYEKMWRDRYYAIKQVAPVVAIEIDKIVVVTVYAFYF